MNATETGAANSAAPIGVFDSGVGGLTVVREMRRLWPHADLVYIGDTLHAPYGARSQEEITNLSLGLSRFLLDCKHARGLVIACNTATAASAQTLRETFPDVPIVGMEPAVKPAARATRTGKVGVLATVGTLASARFAALLARFSGESVQFLTQPCPGLVEAVETGATNTPETRALLESYLTPLLAQNVDTLVLGCTHYPVLRPLIAELVGPNVVLIDTGEAVARRVREVLGEKVHRDCAGDADGILELYTTGETRAFTRAAEAILPPHIPLVRSLVWESGELRSGTN